MKPKTFLLIWRTSDNKYQIVTGPTIEDACTKAGIGRGAIPALDYYSDITVFANSKAMHTLMREISIKDFEGRGYYWKRETCAKIMKVTNKEALVACVCPESKTTGWKPGPAFSVLFDKFCKEV